MYVNQGAFRQKHVYHEGTCWFTKCGDQQLVGTFPMCPQEPCFLLANLGFTGTP